MNIETWINNIKDNMKIAPGFFKENLNAELEKTKQKKLTKIRGKIAALNLQLDDLKEELNELNGVTKSDEVEE